MPSAVVASGGVTSYAPSPTFDMSLRLPVDVLFASPEVDEKNHHSFTHGGDV